jgi:hypothetical protein
VDAAKLVVKGMSSGRRISSPQQIISIINFSAIPGESPDRYRTFPDKFSQALKRYLQGSGRPVNDEFSISSNDRQATTGNDTLRSRAFMKAITGSKYLPLDPDEDRVTVSLPLHSQITVLT